MTVQKVLEFPIEPCGVAGEPLMSEATIEHVQKVVGEKGSDAWWQLPLEDLLPPELRDQAPRLVKGEDTMVGC